LFTSLFYFGELSPQTIFDFMLLYWYSSKLEQNEFRNSPAEFIMYILFSCTLFLFAAIKFGLQFLSPCLSACMLYIWTRRNPNVMVNIMEVFEFRAQFLPWFLMMLVVVFGFDAKDDVIGAVVGHIYYFLADILPEIPETYDMQVLKPPGLLEWFCEYFRIH
jgi:Derlin-2/3